MSLLFDGSEEPLGYGQALVEVASRVSWQTEAHRDEVLLAIQTEHDIVPVRQDPARLYNDPRDLTLRQQDEELATLRKERDNLLAAAKLRAEIEEARRAQGAETTPTAGVATAAEIDAARAGNGATPVRFEA